MRGTKSKWGSNRGGREGEELWPGREWWLQCCCASICFPVPPPLVYPSAPAVPPPLHLHTSLISFPSLLPTVNEQWSTSSKQFQTDSLSIVIDLPLAISGVRLSNTLIHILVTTKWITMESCREIHGPVRSNPNDFVDPLIFHLVQLPTF